MSAERRVRARVARLVWPSNPHSVSLAQTAVELACLVDAGNPAELLPSKLRVTMSHLSECGREPDALDRIRAACCRKALEVFRQQVGRAIRA